jgi:hypothetical protein
MLQLGVRSGIIFNILLVVPYALYILYKKKLLIVGAIFVVAALTGAYLLYLSSGFSRMRMQGAITEMTSKNLRSYDPKSRMLIWPCAIEVF